MNHPEIGLPDAMKLQEMLRGELGITVKRPSTPKRPKAVKKKLHKARMAKASRKKNRPK